MIYEYFGGNRVAQQENMTSTPGQSLNQIPKHVSSTSSIETMHNDNASQSQSAIQPVVSHHSLDMEMSSQTSPFGPQGTIPQNLPPVNYSSQSQVTSHIPATAQPTHVQIQPSTGVIIPSTMPTTNTVPEFLYQLTKMLTDNNRDIIEWSKGKIEVHNPHKLQTHVLNRYFRHSKFASFQRQLNYFGFRKLAGKGKMAPCSYVNDATTKDLGSLLLIKRKVGNEPTKAKSTKKRDRDEMVSKPPAANPALTNIFYRSGRDAKTTATTASLTAPTAQPQPPITSSGGPNQSQQEIARVAVGKGIRHNFSLAKSKPAPLPPRPIHPSTIAAGGTNSLQGSITSGNQASIRGGLQEGLSALESNYKNSLEENNAGGIGSASLGSNASRPAAYVPGSLSHNDSLVDLAMIPFLEDSNGESDSLPFTFIDFPWQDPNSAS